MVTTESITIRVPAGMKKYLADTNTETEKSWNALTFGIFFAMLYKFTYDKAMA